MKKIIALILIVCLSLSMVGCGTENIEAVESVDANKAEDKTILIAAAASLKNCISDEIVPMFEEKYPNITVDATYDSSGKLQTQIEEGADVDVFMSASTKQMNALNEKKLMNEDSIVSLLENKIVLILPKDIEKNITSFEEILKANIIAV
ncbi:MAG: molybdate ABC transporter substrate-binding protein, partial [Sedimentibacter sp.]